MIQTPIEMAMQMMKKSSKTVLITALLIAVALPAILLIIIHIQPEEETPMWDTIVEGTNLPYSEKFWYAQRMQFVFRIVDGDNVWNSDMSVLMRILPIEQRFNPFYTNLVFVDDQQEAIDGGFPDNVVLAWPNDENDFSNRLVGWMNYFVENPHISPFTGNSQRANSNKFTLEDFELPNPLTVEDLTANWGKVWNLWYAFSDEERSRILSRTRFASNLSNVGEQEQ